MRTPAPGCGGACPGRRADQLPVAHDPLPVPAMRRACRRSGHRGHHPSYRRCGDSARPRAARCAGVQSAPAVTSLWIIPGRAMRPASDGSAEAKAASLPPHSKAARSHGGYRSTGRGVGCVSSCHRASPPRRDGDPCGGRRLRRRFGSSAGGGGRSRRMGRAKDKARRPDRSRWIAMDIGTAVHGRAGLVPPGEPNRGKSLS